MLLQLSHHQHHRSCLTRSMPLSARIRSTGELGFLAAYDPLGCLVTGHVEGGAAWLAAQVSPVVPVNSECAQHLPSFHPSCSLHSQARVTVADSLSSSSRGSSRGSRRGSGGGSSRGSTYTLHPTPYTLHPTSYTQHPTP